MGQSTAERLAAVHAEAMADFDRIQLAVRDERMQCLQDRRFYSVAGAPWEGPLGEQFENKPRMEFNETHLAVIRIVNEYLNNQIGALFTPKDGTSNPKLADVCAGLYRADEKDSCAEEAQDNAFEEAVGGGFGAYRLRAEYEDEDDDENDRQRIRMEPIVDADNSVFFDLDAQRQDKSDATRCFVLVGMSHQAFKDEFGHDPVSWMKLISQRYFDWCTDDKVYVAEYYKVEKKTELIHIYRGLDDQEKRVSDAELKEDEDMADTLAATGWQEIRQKKVKRKKVHKYILSGLQVEEDCGLIAGNCIPIVPQYGKRWYVDGIERCMGHVRLAKDAQRLTNTLMSWLTEMASRFDMEKPIFAPEQIAGHERMWADDNVSKFPFLLANSLRDSSGEVIPGSSQPVGYTKAPNVPPAMAALIQVAGEKLGNLLGNQQAGEQLQPNQSGKAVELIQNRLDMQTFIYISNAKKARKRGVEIWLSMAKDVYVEDGRRMKTVSSDGKADSIVLRNPTIDEKTGETVLENDLNDAVFDAYADAGPSSSSKRAATVRALTGMMAITQDPQTLDVLTSAAMMNMEGEGLTELNDFFRSKLVKMGVVKPTKEEEAEMQAAAQQQQQPDPQSQYLLQAAQEAAAGAALKRAQTVGEIASANLDTAKAGEIAARTAGVHPEQQIASATALHGMLNDQAMTGIQAQRLTQPARGA